MKFNRLILSIFLISLSVMSGCSKKESNIISDGSFITLYETSQDISTFSKPTQLWHNEKDVICIVYAYGYNDSEFVTKMNESLYSKYGKAEDGGFILSYVYPDDFKRGSKSYITLLDSYLNEKNLLGMILLGAPEGTHKSIARMQDSHDGKLNFPVISLFSQDDIVAMEDSADFVLDKSQKSEINGLSTESEQTYIENVPYLIEQCVWYCRIADAPFEKNARLYEIVKNLAKNNKVSRYTDSETGLISINHFVLE